MSDETDPPNAKQIVAKRSNRREHDEARSPDDKAMLVALGQQIRAARRSNELTIAQLAAAVGLDPAYLGEVERGRANISVLTLGELGRAIGVTASALLGA